MNGWQHDRVDWDHKCPDSCSLLGSKKNQKPACGNGKLDQCKVWVKTFFAIPN